MESMAMGNKQTTKSRVILAEMALLSGARFFAQIFPYLPASRQSSEEATTFTFGATLSEAEDHLIASE